MTDCGRKDLKPEQARPNNNDIFRKRDLLHNRVKPIYRCQSGLLSRTKLYTRHAYTTQFPTKWVEI